MFLKHRYYQSKRRKIEEEDHDQTYAGALPFSLIIIVTNWLSIEAQMCNPSGNITGKKGSSSSRTTMQPRE